MLSKVFRTLLIIAVSTAIFLSWHYRPAGIGPNDFVDVNPVHNITLDGWRNTNVWLRLAEEAEHTGNLEIAKNYALNALSTDISSGLAMMHLANIYIRQGQQKQAEKIANLAELLAPAHYKTHAYLATFWGKAGMLDKKLSALDVMLTRDSDVSPPLFDLLRELISSPETRPLFDRFATKKTPWWPAFFKHLLHDQRTPLDLLTHVYHLQSTDSVQLDEQEVALYVNRLLMEKQWTTARSIWVENLSTGSSSLRGHIYDGGFEGKRHNTGFDWFFIPNELIDIKQQATFDVEGHNALHLTLHSEQHINFQHIWQKLVLEPTHYELTFRYRIDNFNGFKGLQWRIRCLEDNQLVAESPPLQEITPWSTLTVPFEIPAQGCPIQIIRLEASSQHSYEQVFAGELWFDSFYVRQQKIEKKSNDNSF